MHRTIVIFLLLVNTPIFSQNNLEYPSKDTLFKVCLNNNSNNSLFPTCGFVNKKGDTIIPIGSYAQCWDEWFVGDFTVVCLKDTTRKSASTAVDRNGNILFDIYWWDNGPDWLSDDMIRIVEGNKIGYANSKGQIIIKPQFACASQFSEGKARVAFTCKKENIDLEHSREVSESWFFIDRTGKEIKAQKEPISLDSFANQQLKN